MPANHVRIDYSEVERLTARFEGETDAVYDMRRTFASLTDALMAGGWIGQGANAFYQEMDDLIFPAVSGLETALTETAAALRQVSQIMHDAEDAAAALFQGGDGASSAVAANATSAGVYQNAKTTVIGPDSAGGFHIGPAKHPAISHDNGFSEFCATHANDEVCSSTANPGDYVNRAKYEALLRGAQLAGHLDDGTEAYARYLYGNGEDWHFDYAEYINEDPNGKKTYDNILLEAQRNAEIIGQGRDKFSITSDAFPVGGGDPRFPYPSTENWQKAIGGHQVWTSADVSTSFNEEGKKVYTMTITLHGEDRYNFNPGAADIATNLHDQENGRFEVLGWAHPFMSYGETTTTVSWTEGDIPGSQYSADSPDRGADRRREINDR